MTPFRPPPLEIEELVDVRIQALPHPSRYFRAAVHRFLSFLQTDFPQLRQLSELRRDPHLLGWLRRLSQEDPPLSHSTRRIYLIGLRRLLHELASEGSSLQSGLILPEDFPPGPPLQRKLRLTNYHPRSPLPHSMIGEIFDAHIQTLTPTLRPSTIECYRVAVRSFLSYLQKDFPQMPQLSALRRDPHLLGWLRFLCNSDKSLSEGTRERYLFNLRRLLQGLASAGHPLQPALILPEDFPRWLQQQLRRTNKLPQLLFGEIFEARIQTLATVLRPSTVSEYRCVACHFLAYLQTDFPQLRQFADLSRDPHLCGWLRRLCEQDPPFSNTTRQHYLLNLRRLLHDLAATGHPLQPGLILNEDFPPLPQYLPRALSPEDDRRLQQELRRTDDLSSNALLLTRATGIRIGECIHLTLDSLRSLGQDQWALHVPLGKLYTERLVPVDEDLCHIVTRILTLRAQAPASHLANSAGLLLPRSASPKTLYVYLNLALHQAAARAGCSLPVTCHQLRHTFATEMIRLGISLPALMRLLGHKDIRMTMRYVQVTQADLQRQFHLARQNAVQLHQIPQLSISSSSSANSDLPGIRRTLLATRHLLEMYRRQLQDQTAQRKLQRLDKRLLKIVFELDRFAKAEK
jgi:site-specific recombinase XerD